MSIPYQCIKRRGKALIAARGSCIEIFNPRDGSLLSSWKYPSAQDSRLADSSSERVSSIPEKQNSESSIDIVLENSPPAKRRKLSITVEDSQVQQPNQGNGTKRAEKKILNNGNKRSNATRSGLETPAVIALEGTADGCHVVAVIGEDKSICVFRQEVDGGKNVLRKLSQRVMPKRPCAVALTADDSTIISADKFGDVYSLPLLIPEGPDSEPLKPAKATPEPISAKPFVPAASTLTVHSQRNRKALENQKKQGGRPADKSEPNFEHKLLLGHVSMLTDLALVSLEGRDYILTADRDEHIRVSRGIPQTHVIEGFCLGHTEFISRLCIPRNRPEILISGGGDDELFVWEWLKGVLLSKAGLRVLAMGVMNEISGAGMEDGPNKTPKFAVSGIKNLSRLGNDGAEELVLVACEGVPAVFSFLLTAENRLQHIQTLKVSGNVLDMATDASGLVLSIDTFHKPGSTSEKRETAINRLNALQGFVFMEGELVPSSIKFASAKEEGEDARSLSDLYYGLENLRKREGDTREED